MKENPYLAEKSHVVEKIISDMQVIQENITKRKKVTIRTKLNSDSPKSEPIESREKEETNIDRAQSDPGPN